MWKIPMQPVQPIERQANDCISTALRLGSGTQEGDNNNEAQNSAVHLQVTTPAPVVHLSQPPPQLAQAQAQDATSLTTIRWNSVQTAAAARPRAPRYTASQRLAVKEQVLKAFDEAEEQYELNKRLLKALTDAHTQYSKLKRTLQKGEERWMLEAHNYQSREVALLANIGLLEDRERQLQHQLMLSQEILKAIRMQENFAPTKTDEKKQKEAGTGASCPLCICPHCKRCIHDVVDLSVLSDSENENVKP